MTKQEVQLRGNEKVKEVQALCEKLHLIVSAEQAVMENGFIKQVVYYTDTEKYDVDEEPLTPKTNENAKA